MGDVELTPDGMAVVDGEKVEIVRDEEADDGFTPGQRRKIGEVYLMIAGLLPTEGRDYTVSFSFSSPDSDPRVNFRPVTEIGAAFVRHVANSIGRRRG